MIISEKHKYIYLACPKTATTSTEKFLLEQDPSALQNKIKYTNETKNIR